MFFLRTGYLLYDVVWVGLLSHLIVCFRPSLRLAPLWSNQHGCCTGVCMKQLGPTARLGWALQRTSSSSTTTWREVVSCSVLTSLSWCTGTTLRQPVGASTGEKGSRAILQHTGIASPTLDLLILLICDFSNYTSNTTHHLAVQLITFHGQQ